MPTPVNVTAHAIDIVGLHGDTIILRVECSAGFYIRSLAHDLGERLGVGAHLSALRRTRSGDLTLADAVSLDTLERQPETATRSLVPVARMLATLPAVVLTAEGVRWAQQGRELEKGVAYLFEGGALERARDPFLRLLDPAGDLIGIAEPSSLPGLLHPSVILG